jgi:hypothetical protein
MKTLKSSMQMIVSVIRRQTNGMPVQVEDSASNTVYHPPYDTAKIPGITNIFHRAVKPCHDVLLYPISVGRMNGSDRTTYIGDTDSHRPIP